MTSSGNWKSMKENSTINNKTFVITADVIQYSHSPEQGEVPERGASQHPCFFRLHNSCATVTIAPFHFPINEFVKKPERTGKRRKIPHEFFSKTAQLRPTSHRGSSFAQSALLPQVRTARGAGCATWPKGFAADDGLHWTPTCFLFLLCMVFVRGK